MQNGGFLCKITLCLKQVGYKVSLCANCQRQSCMGGLSIHAKMIGGGRRLKRNFCIKWTGNQSLAWQPCRLALSRNLTNTLFVSQLLQWNTKLLTVFINLTIWGVWMQYMLVDSGG